MSTIPRASQVETKQTSNSQASQADRSAVSTPTPRLPLPEVPSNPKNITLDMSSGDASVKLDHLGPMVVNVDGTLGRITNWEQMGDIEQKSTLRIIGKRNKARLDVLREKEEKEEKV